MFLTRTAKESEFDQVRLFYHALIDRMADFQYKPAWKKGVYPSDAYLLKAVRGQQLHLGFYDGCLAAAMIVNHDSNGGYAGVLWSVDAKADEVMVIHALGVLPSFSGKGFAKEMVRAAISLARQARQKAVRLDVLSGNLPAERLYIGMGFRYVATANMFYEDTGWTDYLLYEYLL